MQLLKKVIDWTWLSANPSWPHRWPVCSAHRSHSGNHLPALGLEIVVHYWDYLDWMCDWSQLKHLYKLKILARFSSSFSLPRQAPYVSSLLINPATYKSGAICLFWGLSLPSLSRRPRDQVSISLWEIPRLPTNNSAAIQKEPKGYPVKLKSHCHWDPMGPQANPWSNLKDFPKKIYKDSYNFFKKTGVVCNTHRSPPYFST